MELTKVEKVGNIWVKREDEFVVAGAYGGKARVVDAIVCNGIDKGVKKFVSCGSRDSRQCEVVARICDYYGVESHLFMPSGKDTSVIKTISEQTSATIHRTKVGYNNVIISNAREYAKENSACYIPFGLECEESIEINMHQVQNIPQEIERIVIPCGGGMNMISVIKGLEHYQMPCNRVLGVIVGKDPRKTFEHFVGHGNDLFENCSIRYDFVKSSLDYHKRPKERFLGDIELDELYEAKCLPFLKDGDLLWIVGKKS